MCESINLHPRLVKWGTANRMECEKMQEIIMDESGLAIGATDELAALPSGIFHCTGCNDRFDTSDELLAHNKSGAHGLHIEPTNKGNDPRNSTGRLILPFIHCTCTKVRGGFHEFHCATRGSK